MTQLSQQVATTGAWMNTNEYSVPVYTVSADQPTVPVKLDDPSVPDLQAAWQQVPLPPDAHPADGTDHHLVVWQPSTDTMWDFWVLTEQPDGWHAAGGGRIDHASEDPGYYSEPGWGATATGLPLLGGLIRISELQAGHIDHALAISIPQARAGVYSWPARWTDGNASDPTAIPEGARFRLDPSLNLDSLNLPPVTRMLAEAAQRYGIVVRDTGADVSFYGEDPTPTGSDPYPALFGGMSSPEALSQFPWSHLQTLQTQLAGI